ncbi:hypothetical protein E2562_030647 [Oryza meyeriana var. granulata]|uniref:Uncharacterized protein n=1 Tax=Oryza meyeriana var. granulata TaxID=110450 RepID=A0A6G1DA75_9ORYZ|nr:hypothetical protein E2562_030647 [Oryza meyeriana var. granulata]
MANGGTSPACRGGTLPVWQRHRHRSDERCGPVGIGPWRATRPAHGGKPWNLPDSVCGETAFQKVDQKGRSVKRAVFSVWLGRGPVVRVGNCAAAAAVASGYSLPW